MTKKETTQKECAIKGAIIGAGIGARFGGVIGATIGATVGATVGVLNCKGGNDSCRKCYIRNN
jgi:uncharacterized membrane protein